MPPPAVARAIGLASPVRGAWRWEKTEAPRRSVSSLFGARNGFRGTQFFHGPGAGGWFWDGSSAIHLFCCCSVTESDSYETPWTRVHRILRLAFIYFIYIKFILFILSLHQLHHTPLDIRFQRLGTSAPDQGGICSQDPHLLLWGCPAPEPSGRTPQSTMKGLPWHPPTPSPGPPPPTHFRHHLRSGIRLAVPTGFQASLGRSRVANETSIHHSLDG